MELGHTLTALKYVREKNCKKYPNRELRTFTGRLKKYMDYVEHINDEKTKCDEYTPHYKALINILKGKDVAISKSIK